MDEKTGVFLQNPINSQKTIKYGETNEEKFKDR